MTGSISLNNFEYSFIIYNNEKKPINIPAEILLDIFSFLDARDIPKVALVSKSWYVVTENNALWCHFFKKVFSNCACNALDSNWKSEYKFHVSSPICQPIKEWIHPKPSSIIGLRLFENEIITASAPRKIRIKNLETDKVEVINTLWDISSLDADEKFIVSGHFRCVTTWERGMNFEGDVFQVEETQESANHVKILSNWLAGSFGNFVRIWELNSKDARTFSFARSKITSFEITPPLLIAISNDMTAIWNIESYLFLRKFPVAGQHLCVNKILMVGNKSNVFLYQTNTYKMEKLRPPASSTITCLSYSGDYIFAGSDDGTISLWNKNTYKCVRTIKTGSKITAMDVFDNAVAVGFDNDMIKIFNFSSYFMADHSLPDAMDRT